MAESENFYEYIVVGCGGIGSATLYWLSKLSDSSVLGIEQFELGHDNGGSQDHSRMIRHDYHDELYTRLTRQTFETWEEVEKESGIQLVHKTGCLDLFRRGTSRMDTLRKIMSAMDAQNLPYEHLTSSEVMSRFPQWSITEDTEGLYHPGGGFVDAALANSVNIQLAQAHGARVIENCTVTRLQPIADNQCLLHTNKGRFRCRRVIVTAGAWINQILGSVGVEIPVTVTQEQVSYIATPHVKNFTKQNFPIFGYKTPNGFNVYGMPCHVNSYFKIGIDAVGNEVLPGTRTYEPDPVREKYSMQFCKKFLPKAVGPIKYTKTCLYTMTLDRNFVVDTLSSKGMPQIVICCGAGHAFKFACLLGKILSELAINDSTSYNIDGFRFQREAVQNKNYKPEFWRGDMRTARL